MASLNLSPVDRLLVVAPHPDDETLSSGMLIQSAVAAGATVRVVFATDGDNNPWPQRWLERRWTIGPMERARWGQRRRSEAVVALAMLGVSDTQGIRFLGWPDQGLTDCLMSDDSAVSTLRDEILRFEPTHVVMPALADRHPDHSALRILLDLALLRAGTDCVRLGYVVHGENAQDGNLIVLSAADYQQRKCAAMESHASQMALSRRRLLAIAARPEYFQMSGAASATPDNTTTLRIAYARHSSLSRHDLLLVIATKNETLRFRVPLGSRAWSSDDAAGQELVIERDVTALTIMLPRLPVPLAAAYAKIDRIGSRLVIFDKEPWHEASEVMPQSDETIKRQAAASPV